jgi:hypothetical protein
MSTKNVHQNFVSLAEILIYCLDVLRIKDDESEIRRNTVEYFKKIPIESVKSYNNEWLASTKVIADIYSVYNQSCNDDHIFFSQSQVSDFLTLAARGIDEKEISTRKMDIIFNIFRDITQNYQKFDFALKSSYPKIIVDVMFILYRGSDSVCKKISLLGIDELKASEGTIAAATAVDMHTTRTTTTITTTKAEQHLGKDPQIQQQLIEFLIQMNGKEGQGIRGIANNIA